MMTTPDRPPAISENGPAAASAGAEPQRESGELSDEALELVVGGLSPQVPLELERRYIGLLDEAAGKTADR